MNKNFAWVVITIKDADGGLSAYADKIGGNNNIIYQIPKNAVTVTIAPTKKEAEDWANASNRAYVENGTAAEWLK